MARLLAEREFHDPWLLNERGRLPERRLARSRQAIVSTETWIGAVVDWDRCRLQVLDFGCGHDGIVVMAAGVDSDSISRGYL